TAARLCGARQVAVDLDIFCSREGELLRGDRRRVGDGAGDALWARLDLNVRHLSTSLSVGLWTNGRREPVRGTILRVASSPRTAGRLPPWPRRARESCGAPACVSRSARPRAWRARRRGGGPARADDRC